MNVGSVTRNVILENERWLGDLGGIEIKRATLVKISLIFGDGKECGFGLSLACFLGLFLAFAAADHSPLQDFCVAQAGGSVFVRWHGLQGSQTVKANDFSFSGLHLPGNKSNPVGSRVTPVTVAQLPGLNTLGISAARIDIAPWGINPPHIHPAPPRFC
ncbi:putative germin-like protein 2-1 [Eucalyptus grandis]|uniref:putative germin-like protein 2-1 n=1 Tax=Eucalyptus grandis TaxID=71139 RepID=UPI00192EF89B|nr:putative germin-like protein 2-1 [Eucalyptus grandis]